MADQNRTNTQKLADADTLATRISKQVDDANAFGNGTHDKSVTDGVKQVADRAGKGGNVGGTQLKDTSDGAGAASKLFKR